MSRTPAQWYEQILAACDAALDLEQRGRTAFERDRLLQRAAKNICLEVGEAAKQIDQADPDELGATAYGRWPLVIRMRDFYGHNHPVTDLAVLWNTIVDDLPEIGDAVRARLTQLRADG